MIFMILLCMREPKLYFCFKSRGGGGGGGVCVGGGEFWKRLKKKIIKEH